MLQIKNLVAGYGKVQVLHGISIHVQHLHFAVTGDEVFDLQHGV